MNDNQTTRDSRICDLSVVKNLRKKLGFSAEELAEKAGLTRGTVLKIEAGQGNPTLQTIEALARVLRLAPSELVRMTESEMAETGQRETFDQRGYQGARVRFGDFELYHLRLQAGAETEFDPSIHENTWEVCFVLAGSLRVSVGGQHHSLTAGMALRFKALHEHHIEVLEEAEVVLIHYSTI